MRVKLEWLNELVDLEGLSIKEIVDTVSLYSIEVEGVEKVVDGTNLVVGKVLSKTKHPDSDHLNICSVDIGKETLQIVCGAPNVEAGQIVIVALVGAILPGDFKIKPSKIRGVESFGMICSLKELGMEKKYIPHEYEDGIYYFKNQVELGKNALEALDLNDEVIELGITPNRGDLLSMIGVAIEFAATFNRQLKPLIYKVLYEEEKSGDYINIENKSEGCLSYYAQVVKDITIKESPWWLTSRLISFGIRSINNVVDITNYILALFGQPLHAFDLNKLGNKIVVRDAKDNEEIMTLDNQSRKLSTDDIVITDGNKIVALAGVMGGLETEVTNETKNLVIEAAVFDPARVRKTSQKLNLRSESSMRFERGVDINRTKFALDYTCYLLQTLADAKILKDPAFLGTKNVEDTLIKIDKDEINKLLGTNINTPEIVDIFKRLGFEVEGKEKLEVYVPNRRPDIKIKADLIEEVARIYGYSKMEETLPKINLVGGLNLSQEKKRIIKKTLKDLGLKEVITYSLVTTALNKTFTYNHVDNSEVVSLLMPLTEEHKELRESLIPSLVEVAKYNNSRKVKDINIFELGKTYYFLNDEKNEELTLGLLLTNNYASNLWRNEIEKVDFYLVKGILENLFSILDVKVTYRPIQKQSNELHPKRSAELVLDNKVIGFIGELHPKFSKENDLDEVVVVEIKVDDIINKKEQIVKYQTISKTPSMERDIAIVMNKDILAGDIIDTILKNAKKYMIADAKIFDCYIGEKIKADEKSIAIKLTFSSNETLTDEIVNKNIEKILKMLEVYYNATLRK